MLAAGVMNGLVIWIYNIINWFKRVYYHFKGAVSVFATCQGEANSEGSWRFSFMYEGREKTVKVIEPAGKDVLEKLTPESGEVELLWIPEKKNAMLMRYYDNKGLLACDLGSIISLVLLIAGMALIYTSTRNPGGTVWAMALTYISIPCMIILSIIRKKFRKY